MKLTLRSKRSTAEPKATTKTKMAPSAQVAEKNAVCAENDSLALRELRKERQSWLADRLELEHLRKVVDSKQPVSLHEELQTLLEDKALHEQQMDACGTQISRLKENVQNLKTELRESGDIILQLKSRSSEARRIEDLEEQVDKWETLYFESAEMGERQIERLERELEDTKEKLSKAKKDTSDNQNEISSERTTSPNNAGFETLQKRIKELEAEASQKELEVHRQLRMQLEEANEKIETLETQISMQKEAHSRPIPGGSRFETLQKRNKELESEASHNDLVVQRQLRMQLDQANEKVEALEMQLASTESLKNQLHGKKITSKDIDEGARGETLDDESSVGSEMERYIADLEKQLQNQQRSLEEASERLEQERNVARNREASLKKQVASMEADIAMQDSDVRIHLKESRQRVQELETRFELLAQGLDEAPMANMGDSESELLILRSRMARQEVELGELRRNVTSAQTENRALRKVKDSLIGIDKEMEQVIKSLEEHQIELKEQKEKADNALAEAASLKKYLDAEIIAREALLKEKEKIEVDFLKTQDRLDKVYMELKDEQASHEEEVGLMKQQAADLKASIVYQKSSLDMMQEAIHEANAEIRNQSLENQSSGQISSSFGTTSNQKNEKSLPSKTTSDSLGDLKAERDQLKLQVQTLSSALAARGGENRSTGTPAKENEIHRLNDRIMELEAEKDALDLEANMAVQENKVLEARLKNMVA